MRIYVAGRYDAPNVCDVLANMRRGIALSYEVLRLGHAPFCPWLDFQFGLHGEVTREQYQAVSMEWLRVSDGVLVVPEGAAESKGTQAELAEARRLHLPIIWAEPGWQHALTILAEQRNQDVPVAS